MSVRLQLERAVDDRQPSGATVFFCIFLSVLIGMLFALGGMRECAKTPPSFQPEPARKPVELRFHCAEGQQDGWRI